MEDSKLHEETLKIAKSLIERDPALKDWVTEKFPELKESEDERIRKATISFLEYYEMLEEADHNSTEGIKECIAWLEKQGEWSEEDGKTIEEAISLINMLAYGYGEKVTEPITFNGVKMINDIKERLRNLHHKTNHWKPSEQNIKDLEWCADLVQDKMGVGFHRLQVFIDELKKL